MFSTSAFVRKGAILSAVGHIAFVAGVLGLFAHPKLFTVTSDPAVMVDIVSPKDVPQLDLSKFDVPEFGEAKAQKAEVAKPPSAATQSASTATQSAPQATQPAPQAKQTTKLEPQAAQAEPLAPQPEPQGQATLTPPAQPAKPQSVFAPTEIPALLDLVTPATSAGLAPLAEVPADIKADNIATFKAHLRKCWSPPPGASADPKLKVVLRVFLARNGALAQPPVLMAASASPSGPALVQTATAAMKRCAPFSFLPPDRYKEWKVLDVTLSAGDMGGG
jgi:hypothetical protein